MQLTSSFCSMLVLMNLTLTNVVALMYFSPLAPFSGPACSAVVFASNFFLTLGLLFLDTIIVLRYLYIFRWKTVGAVNDDLFAVFATVNNVVIAFLFSLVRIHNLFFFSGTSSRNGTVYLKLLEELLFPIFPVANLSYNPNPLIRLVNCMNVVSSEPLVLVTYMHSVMLYVRC